MASKDYYTFSELMEISNRPENRKKHIEAQQRAIELVNRPIEEIAGALVDKIRKANKNNK